MYLPMYSSTCNPKLSCTSFHTPADKGESVRANLRQYGLEAFYLDMVITDAARCVWREGELFDAIITDRELVTRVLFGFYCTFTFIHVLKFIVHTLHVVVCCECDVKGVEWI